jgi:type IX secretion system PorP/SprF family membrane protein
MKKVCQLKRNREPWILTFIVSRLDLARCDVVRFVFSCFLLFCSCFSFSQDIHFSQFWAQPLYLNSAQTGLFDGDYRVGGMYRNQWRSVPVPYATLSLFADTKFKKVLNQRNDIGVGLVFNNDISGDSRYSINQFYVPVSFIQTFKSDTNLTASFGLMPGISNIAFRTNKLTFDNQFDGDAYNSSYSSGENFPTLSRTYFDLGSALAFQYKIKSNGMISVGTSLSHINRPGVSFFKNNDVKLYAKSTSFLSLKYPLAQKLFLHVDAMYEKQGPFHEAILAGRISYLLNPKDNIALSAGLSSRLGDAGIFLLGMDYKDYRFGFAYDINYSKFVPATNKRGAWEIGLIYIFRKNPVFIPVKRACPTDM